MRYELMRPNQIRDAVAGGLPLLLPVGVLEYHGHQNPLGVDALIAQGLAHALEKRVSCVVAPTVFYGYTGEWAADEQLGEIHLDGDAVYAFAKPILRGFFGQGWRRIYVICHHQGPHGVTQLGWQRAATEAAFEFARRTQGPGWYRCREELGQRVFGTIRVVNDAEFAARGYGGHGGGDETAAMLFFYPQSVDLAELRHMEPRPYWARDAERATPELGREIGEGIIESWVKELTSFSAKP